MYDLIISTRRFKDPASGKITKPGELCLQDTDGTQLHIDSLPVRRLVPLKQYLKGTQIESKTNQQCPFMCKGDCDTCPK